MALYLHKGNFKEEGLILDCSLRVWSIMVGNSRRQKLEAVDHIALQSGREGDECYCCQLLCFPFIQSRLPAGKEVIPHGHAQRLVSHAILNSVKLTISFSLHNLVLAHFHVVDKNKIFSKK